MGGSLRVTENQNLVIDDAVLDQHLLDRGCLMQEALVLLVAAEALALRWLLQGDHVGAARVEVLSEPADRATLARRIATLEDDHQTAPSRVPGSWTARRSDPTSLVADRVVRTALY